MNSNYAVNKCVRRQLKRILSLMSVVCCLWSIAGCQTMAGTTTKGIPFRAIDSTEAQWIRDGEPIEFEGKLWYPIDGVEGFLDSEMLLVGEQWGVQYFVDKVDVRPYGRLYTKFDNNKFRFFEKRISE